MTQHDYSAVNDIHLDIATGVFALEELGTLNSSFFHEHLKAPFHSRHHIFHH
jgi:hypothetical protein